MALVNGYIVGPGVDLTSANLTDVDLTGFDLSSTDLTGATLTGVRSGGSITGTPTLSAAYNLFNGYIVGPGVNLNGANLTDINLVDVDLRGADLKGVNLTNASLVGGDLRGVDLRGANLTGAVVRVANLEKVDLTGANLIGTDLSDSYIGEANLTNANLTDAILKNVGLNEADLSNAVLTGADLGNGTFFSFNLTGVTSGSITGTPTLLGAYSLVNGFIVGPAVNLSGADLTGADLSGINLTHSNLKGADLTGANLTGVDLSNADLTGVITGSIIGMPTTLPPSYGIYNGYIVGPGVNLNGADLTNVNLRYFDLTDVSSGDITGNPTLPEAYSIISGYIVGPSVSLTGADLSGLDLSSFDLTGVSSGSIIGTPTLPESYSLVNGHILGASVNLADADLTGFNLSGFDLSSANLTGVTSGSITGTPTLPESYSLVDGYIVGPGVNLGGADLSGVDLSGAVLNWGSKLNSVDLTGANLKGADLRGADLRGADLTGANLDKGSLWGADVTNAIIDTDDWHRIAADQQELAIRSLFNNSPNGTLSITGSAEANQTLSADTSNLTDNDSRSGIGSFSYQWIRAGTDISSAKSSTYVLTQTDVGYAITVRVSYTDGGGTTESVTSSETNLVTGSANVTDTSGDDIVTGTAYADTIGAGIGRDVVDALGDDDTINLIGNSYYDGLSAHNVGSTTQVATNVKLDLTGKVKLKTVVDGGADADIVNLSSSGDAFFLHDSFSGFHSSLSLTTDTHTGAQSTQRILNVETINGLAGDDIIDLTSSDYSLAGQVITINGGTGNDVIWGSDATETLIGGEGNDVLFGGSGNDTLTGGSGADTFEFTRTAGSDTITDFQSGTDNIKLYSDYTFNISKTDSTTADYSIDDQLDPTLYLVRGKTYTFEMSGNGHPFYIKSTSSTSGTSDEYTDGVTRIGSANSGSDGDKLQFTATSETPDTLWYQCSAHSGMIGQINIVDRLSETVQTSGNDLIWNTLTIQSDTAIYLYDVSFVAIA